MGRLSDRDGTLGLTAEIDASGQQLRMVLTDMIDGDSLSGAFATDFGDLETMGTRAVE